MTDSVETRAALRAEPECPKCLGKGLVTIGGRGQGYCACTAAVPKELSPKELESIEDRLMDASTPEEEVQEIMKTCGISPEELERIERSGQQLKFFMKLLGAQRRRMVQHLTEAAERVESIPGNFSGRLRAFVRIFATLEGVVPNTGQDD